MADFFAYAANFAGGVYVAAGDVNGGGVADIVTGAGAGGGPHVMAFGVSGLVTWASFFADQADFRGGVTVAATDLDGLRDAEIVVGQASGGSQVRTFDLEGGSQPMQMNASSGLSDGAFVAGSAFGAYYPSNVGGSSGLIGLRDSPRAVWEIVTGGSGLPVIPVEPLTEDQLDLIRAAVFEQWQEAGLSTRIASLIHQVVIRQEHLPAGVVAKVRDEEIILALDADGYLLGSTQQTNGWFVDSTPQTDEEFTVATNGASPLCRVAMPKVGLICLLHPTSFSLRCLKWRLTVPGSIGMLCPKCHWAHRFDGECRQNSLTVYWQSTINWDTRERSMSSTCHCHSRRDFLRDSFCGLGSLALLSLLSEEQARAAPRDPLAPKPPHMANAKARSVIFLFMAGGPSHVETFDPKPLLNELDGQPRPAEFGEAKYQFIERTAKLLGTARKFKRYGECGLEVSDLFPHTAQCIDDIAVLRSCYGDMVVHSAAQYELFTGRVVPGFPSMGSWSVYGLGSESRSLPAYVVMPDPDGALEAGQPMYTHGFLPAVYQPTMFSSGPQPVRNLGLPAGRSLEERRRTVELIRDLNQAELPENDPELEARIASYDLAFRMQTEAPEVFDLSRETQQTLDLYGVGVEPTDDYGRRCLLARRLVEHGVRFTVVVSGGGPGNLQWDAHKDIEENHLRMAPQVDRPIAGLLKDLKQRGLLDSTLVLWGGEFGRSPEAQGGKGRDHHNLGFTMWLAGGGIKGGQAVGATDAIGLRAVEEPIHFRDLHTTILHQLGLDQDQLNYLHLGRRERLTLVHGKVIEKIV